MKRTFLLLPLLLTVIALPIAAQESLAPPEITGEVVYVPFPLEITLDGQLDDWTDVPHFTVDRGPMTSADPAENGSFAFAVAADADNFYITMTMLDQNIIAGQHQTNFWNEDSLEFYLNLSGDLTAAAYTDGIFQININATDIGNTDPAAITITGTSSANAGVQAMVFETEDGWGFEAAVPLGDDITPAHGLTVGFQAQANGATTQDRDVKLIWSLADTADTSWNNPSVFGSAIFFEIGRTDVPEISPQATAAPTESAAPERSVSVNQVGYFPDSAKFGMLAGEGQSEWSVINAASGEIVAQGTTSEGVYDGASGDTVQTADFSELTTAGMYKLVIDGVESVPFQIGTDIYSQLKNDALRYFYLNRSGIELTPELAGEWARPAGHISDSAVTCFSGTDADGKTWDGCDYHLNVQGGWYDAGDYGKYVVNGGITTWTLLNLYERLPESFPDGSLPIPENANGVPDILDEARWEMEFLLNMQVPEGQPLAGMVHHKMHDRRWSGVPVMPTTEIDSDDPNNGRFLMPPSTAATLNMAATAAQCARIWKDIDPEFSQRCLTAAETAWAAANANPVILAGRTPGEGGGDYGDGSVNDEFYWAAAELYITTGKTEYADFLTASDYFEGFTGLRVGNVSPMTWGDTAALGTISLVTVPSELPQESIEMLQKQIVDTAERYLTTLTGEGYRAPLTEGNYYWGSNSFVLNNAIIFALAYDFTGDERFVNGVTESMDYLLGRNGLSFSFISGYGTNTAQHFHHRFWGNRPASGFPAPPPGSIAGGPNGQPSDPDAMVESVMALQPAKRYLDVIGSYSTNEVAINWNAPLTWVAAYLDAHHAAP